MTDIKIITTGGTIDKIYFDARSEFQVGAPQIGEVLKEANVTLGYDITALLRKDSLELGDADRQAIRAAGAARHENWVIVTHGTDTMVDTARALADIPDKTIVLTGALSPARFQASDAVFNIGMAVAAVQACSAGVWIAMSGHVFRHDEVRKNRGLNRFELLPPAG
jgi:L-asparaginase